MEGKGGSKISRKTAFYREIEAAFLGKRIFYNVFISRVSLERVRRQDGVALRDGLREYQAPFGRDVAERPPLSGFDPCSCKLTKEREDCARLNRGRP